MYIYTFNFLSDRPETKMHHIKLSFFLACFEEILLFNLFLKYSVVNL